MLNTTLKTQLSDIYKSGDPLKADSFFGDFKIVPGRMWDVQTGKTIQPYERLKQYESLLKEISQWNKEIYFFVHKGTSFYYCGILSFDIEAYDRATFYFDAALSEDFKNKRDWKTNCAAYHFYILDDKYSTEIVQYPVGRIKNILKPLIDEFNTKLNAKNNFTLDYLINNFVIKKIKEKEYRSIIPALYIFIAESEQNLFRLSIRSDSGGSIEPFISHLLKGCLIFESLLRLIYSSHFSSEGLEKILNDSFIKQELRYCTKSNVSNKDLISYSSGVRKTLQDIISHLIPYLERYADVIDQWFTITYALRNVTTHNLSWPDVFNPDNYEKLYKSVLFSIFYLIKNKY